MPCQFISYRCRKCGEKQPMRLNVTSLLSNEEAEAMGRFINRLVHKCRWTSPSMRRL